MVQVIFTNDDVTLFIIDQTENRFFPDGSTKLFPTREEPILEKINKISKLCGDVFEDVV